jgi:23S rRNA (cytidine2498-2'-O)-methyltransferase
MHVVIATADSEAELHSELRACLPAAPRLQAVRSGLVETEFPIIAAERLAYLAFARQLLPDAKPLEAESIRSWANQLLEAVAASVPESQPWFLHIEPHYGSSGVSRIGARAFHTLKLRRSDGSLAGSKLHNAKSARLQNRGTTNETKEAAVPVVGPAAGSRRCELIREALLELMQKKRRQLLRNLSADPAPFSPVDSLVQVLLTAPESGFVSVAVAPRPFEHRHLISPFPKGEVSIANDKAAPSRAFAKLAEAQLRLGRKIERGEMCVDLGASPGSWTYIAINRKAHVIAVDRSPLRHDLMHNPLVHFVSGDAFDFQPRGPVDWLLCDVIAPPERTAELLLYWLRQRWCRKFVVTLKLKETGWMTVLERLKRELPPITEELFISRLSANKKEVCAFGVAREV